MNFSDKLKSEFPESRYLLLGSKNGFCSMAVLFRVLPWLGRLGFSLYLFHCHSLSTIGPETHKMLFTTALASLVASTAAARDKGTFAVLRHYGRGPLTVCRADPIVNPGTASRHLHTVMGASNFGLNSTGEDLRESHCTTALPKADMSAYWVLTLFIKDLLTVALRRSTSSI